MATEIIINATTEETRVALLENKEVSELYIDRRKESGVAGNIYKGKVVKILPGIQAAFVDIGLERAAFLYVTDAGADAEEYARMIEEEGLEGKMEFRSTTQHSIEDILQEGQEIMVQVSKEPIGTKGARITSYVSLPGRYLVLMTTVEHIGISRRIKDNKERERLKEMVQAIKKPGSGFIVRTASESVDKESLIADAEFLELLWQNVQKKKETASAPALVYSELDLIFRTIRDMFTTKVDRLVIDSKTEYERITEFVRLYLPAMLPRVELYEGEEHIFEAYDIEAELNKALDKKVGLLHPPAAPRHPELGTRHRCPSSRGAVRAAGDGPGAGADPPRATARRRARPLPHCRHPPAHPDPADRVGPARAHAVLLAAGGGAVHRGWKQ